jgi:hypothetical protein
MAMGRPRHGSPLRTVPARANRFVPHGWDQSEHPAGESEGVGQPNENRWDHKGPTQVAGQAQVRGGGQREKSAPEEYNPDSQEREACPQGRGRVGCRPSPNKVRDPVFPRCTRPGASAATPTHLQVEASAMSSPLRRATDRSTAKSHHRASLMLGRAPVKRKRSTAGGARPRSSASPGAAAYSLHHFRRIVRLERDSWAGPPPPSPPR